MAVVHGFEERATDFTLALDELVANALRHGLPPVTVTTWYDGRLVLEVADVGPGFDATRLPDRLPSRLGHGGRGLWILRQVCDHVTITSSEHGTRVRVEMTHEPQLGA